MAHEQLTTAIVALSTAKRWDQARFEWDLERIYFADEPETCLCGHHPIIELCVLRNRRNRRLAVVGNHCVKKFMNLGSERIFSGMRRIQRDIEAALNADSIEYARERGWLNEWEHSFYVDTWRKHQLSERQRDVRVRLNRKVLEMVGRDRRGTHA